MFTSAALCVFAACSPVPDAGLSLSASELTAQAELLESTTASTPTELNNNQTDMRNSLLGTIENYDAADEESGFVSPLLSPLACDQDTRKRTVVVLQALKDRLLLIKLVFERGSIELLDKLCQFRITRNRVIKRCDPGWSCCAGFFPGRLYIGRTKI